jgi:hypothetical protein
MEKTKVTEKELYGMIVELAKANDREDIIAFAKKKIAQLENKKTASKKDEQVNIDICNLLVDTLIEIGEPITITNLIKNEKVANYTYTQKVGGEDMQVGITNQKATYILNNMAQDKVSKENKKGTSYYFVK